MPSHCDPFFDNHRSLAILIEMTQHWQACIGSFTELNSLRSREYDAALPQVTNQYDRLNLCLSKGPDPQEVLLDFG